MGQVGVFEDQRWGGSGVCGGQMSSWVGEEDLRVLMCAEG